MLLHQNIQIFFIPLIRVVSVIKLYNEGIRELFYEKFLPIYILIINMNLFECKEGAMVGKFGRVDKRTTTATNLFVDFDLTDFADFMLILSSMALNSLLELVDFEDVIGGRHDGAGGDGDDAGNRGEAERGQEYVYQQPGGGEASHCE